MEVFLNVRTLRGSSPYVLDKLGGTSQERSLYRQFCRFTKVFKVVAPALASRPLSKFLFVRLSVAKKEVKIGSGETACWTVRSVDGWLCMGVTVTCSWHFFYTRGFTKQSKFCFVSHAVRMHSATILHLSYMYKINFSRVAEFWLLKSLILRHAPLYYICEKKDTFVR